MTKMGTSILARMEMIIIHVETSPCKVAMIKAVMEEAMMTKNRRKSKKNKVNLKWRKLMIKALKMVNQKIKKLRVAKRMLIRKGVRKQWRKRMKKSRRRRRIRANLVRKKSLSNKKINGVLSRRRSVEKNQRKNLSIIMMGLLHITLSSTQSSGKVILSEVVLDHSCSHIL